MRDGLISPYVSVRESAGSPNAVLILSARVNTTSGEPADSLDVGFVYRNLNKIP